MTEATTSPKKPIVLYSQSLPLKAYCNFVVFVLKSYGILVYKLLK